MIRKTRKRKRRRIRKKESREKLNKQSKLIKRRKSLILKAIQKRLKRRSQRILLIKL